MRLVCSIRIFRGKLFELLNPLSLFMLPLLFFQRCLHGPVEVLGADGFQNFVAGIQVLDFVQLGEIREGRTTLFGLFEAVVVQLQQLDTPPNGGLGKAGLVGNLLYRLPEIHHHLEALGLFVDGEV